MNRMHLAVASYTGGSVVTFLEVVKGLNVILGLIGTILMVAGGVYAFLLKKKEWEDKNS